MAGAREREHGRAPDAARTAGDERDAVVRARRSPRAPAEQRARPRHARAEAGAQHEVAVVHAAVVDGLEQRERDRRRRRVAVAVDVDERALGLEAEPVARRRR